jgi:hypothetical protein
MNSEVGLKSRKKCVWRLSIFTLAVVLSAGLVFSGCGGGNGGGEPRDTATATIGPEGGTIRTPKGIEITIPQDAVNSSTTFTVKGLSIADVEAELDGVTFYDTVDPIRGFKLTTSSLLQKDISFVLPVSDPQANQGYLLLRVVQDTSGPMAEVVQWGTVFNDTVVTMPIASGRTIGPSIPSRAFENGGTFLLVGFDMPQFPLAVTTMPGALITATDSSNIRSVANANGIALINVQARVPVSQQQGVLVIGVNPSTQLYNVGYEIISVPPPSLIADFLTHIDLNLPITAIPPLVANYFCRDESKLKQWMVDELLKGASQAVTSLLNNIIADVLTDMLHLDAMTLTVGETRTVHLSVQGLFQKMPINIDLGQCQAPLLKEVAVTLKGVSNSISIKNANATIIITASRIAHVSGPNPVEFTPENIVRDMLIAAGEEGITQAQVQIDITKYIAEVMVCSMNGENPACEPVPVIRPGQLPLNPWRSDPFTITVIGVPTGSWVLDWGSSGTRFFAYSDAWQETAAVLMPDGKLGIKFNMMTTPTADVTVENIAAVPLGTPVECSMIISYSDNYAVSGNEPWHTWRTYVTFTQKELTLLGKISGSFSGKLGIFPLPDPSNPDTWETVTIISAPFTVTYLGRGN